jgi:hypothetical protein
MHPYSILLIIVVGLWTMPLGRAMQHAGWSWQYYRETQSINASNDLTYGITLLISYEVGLLISVGLAYQLVRTRQLLLLILLTLALAEAISINRFKPEEPIMLFPVIHPLRPAACYIALGIAGFALFRLGHKLPRDLKNAVNVYR